MTGKKFIDTDIYLVEKTGHSIPEIFATQQEIGFRALETEVLAALGKQSGLVIATGGGCVTQERNYPLLRQNGTLFWLQRNLELLPVEGRPLSQITDLGKMYEVRQPMYGRFADHIVDNNGDPEATANTILGILEGNV